MEVRWITLLEINTERIFIAKTRKENVVSSSEANYWEKKINQLCFSSDIELSHGLRIIFNNYLTCAVLIFF